MIIYQNQFISQLRLISLDNKYTKWYCELIAIAKVRKTPNTYIEEHHIIPDSFFANRSRTGPSGFLEGNPNSQENLVQLTAREHFICHILLIKMFTGKLKRNMSYAIHRLRYSKNNTYVANSKIYEFIKRTQSESMSGSNNPCYGKSLGHKFAKGHNLFSGENNGMYGKSHSIETRNMQREKALQRGSAHLKGIAKSTDHKEKMRLSRQTKKFKLISPSGEEFIFHRAAEASIFCKISTGTLHKLASGRYKYDHCNGWRCIGLPL